MPVTLRSQRIRSQLGEVRRESSALIFFSSENVNV